MKKQSVHRLIVSGLALLPSLALAFNSGSTGADGDFSPTVNTELQLPPSGVFNFVTVNIPTGVTVTVKKNTANTPAVLLASGNVSIAGTLTVSGAKGADSGAFGTGNLGDDGQPGKGGPGGFDGGRGGMAGATAVERIASAGLGPGGGGNGFFSTGSPNYAQMGGGGAFGASLGAQNCGGVPGTPYGSSLLLPLIGGSGGGGGSGGLSYPGAGGGGGGGAILVAASGTINVTGSLLAHGGAGGGSSGDGRGAPGGGGSGGAIRLVATTIAGNGTIGAGAGGYYNAPSNGSTAGYFVCENNTYGGVNGGSVGRIRFEAENMTRTAAAAPTASIGTPGSLFVAGLPTLTISSVAGVAAPANPTGNADITLPANTPNPVTVVFTTTGVPVGNTIKLTLTPVTGAPVSAISPALTGTTDSATTSVQIALPAGPSVLQAQTTYTIVAALGDALSTYAENERVEKITLTATPGQASQVTLVTVSGKTFDVPAAVLAKIHG